MFDVDFLCFFVIFVYCVYEENNVGKGVEGEEFLFVFCCSVCCCEVCGDLDLSNCYVVNNGVLRDIREKI